MPNIVPGDNEFTFLNRFRIRVVRDDRDNLEVFLPIDYVKTTDELGFHIQQQMTHDLWRECCLNPFKDITVTYKVIDNCWVIRGGYREPEKRATDGSEQRDRSAGANVG